MPGSREFVDGQRSEENGKGGQENVGEKEGAQASGEEQDGQDKALEGEDKAAYSTTAYRGGRDFDGGFKLQHLGKALNRRVVGRVFATLVLVDSRTGRELVNARLDA